MLTVYLNICSKLFTYVHFLTRSDATVTNNLYINIDKPKTIKYSNKTKGLCFCSAAGQPLNG